MAPKSRVGGGGAKAPSAHPSRGPCYEGGGVSRKKRKKKLVAALCLTGSNE